MLNYKMYSLMVSVSRCHVCHVFPRLLCPYLVVSCPCLIRFLVKSVLAVFGSLASVFKFLVCSASCGRSILVTPGVPVLSALPCPASLVLSTLKTYLRFTPRLRVPVSSSCVTVTNKINYNNLSNKRGAVTELHTSLKRSP